MGGAFFVSEDTMTDTQFAKLLDGLSEAKAALGTFTPEFFDGLNDAELEYVVMHFEKFYFSTLSTLIRLREP
jgi:hypothetical protein